MLSIGKNEYPSKRTVNLVIHEKTMGSPSRAIPLFLLFIVFLALFVKFGVLNQLERMLAAQSSLKQVQVDLEGYIAYNRDYEEVQEKYSLYFEDYLTEDEAVLQDRLEILKILENSVLNRGKLSKIEIRGNICRADLTRVSLGTVADIMEDLNASPLVKLVTVSTAETEDKDESPEPGHMMTAYITITLKGGQEQ
ncbi:MAG: hypothetical protein LIP16_06670 [Clostridium sp.]|nr:hypothetical protein [Clostridium sp.]